MSRGVHNNVRILQETLPQLHLQVREIQTTQNTHLQEIIKATFTSENLLIEATEPAQRGKSERS